MNDPAASFLTVVLVVSGIATIILFGVAIVLAIVESRRKRSTDAFTITVRDAGGEIVEQAEVPPTEAAAIVARLHADPGVAA